MRKLIAQQFVTVNNIAAEEGGGLSFFGGQPFATSSDEDFKINALEFLDSVDTMLLGANTYAMFKEYWPHAKDEGEFGQKINSLTKVVASTKLTDAPWGDFSAATVTPDPVTTIAELKQQKGKDIVLWGSLTLMQSLLDARLVDEVQLRVCPTTRPNGTPMFKDQREMSLVEAKSFKNGLVLLRYALKNETHLL